MLDRSHTLPAVPSARRSRSRGRWLDMRCTPCLTPLRFPPPAGGFLVRAIGCRPSRDRRRPSPTSSAAPSSARASRPIRRAGSTPSRSTAFEDSGPTPVTLRIARQDGYRQVVDRRVVYLSRDGGGVPALDSTCTHLGCRTRYDSESPPVRLPVPRRRLRRRRAGGRRVRRRRRCAGWSPGRGRPGARPGLRWTPWSPRSSTGSIRAPAIARCAAHALDEPLPPGTGWTFTTGSVVALLVGVQFVTGVGLAMYYVPSPALAYDSMRYLIERGAARLAAARPARLGRQLHRRRRRRAPDPRLLVGAVQGAARSDVDHRAWCCCC